jgi:hypothetical protein
MKYPKRIYPHIYEYQRIGWDTPEGVKYREVHDKIMNKEYNEHLDIRAYRTFRGHKFFHKITEDEIS